MIVHGVGIDTDGWSRVARAGAGLVWCPASNDFLFGRTAPIRRLLDLNGQAPAIALGTDSRVTGSRDLLDELRVARDAQSVAAAELFEMVTTKAAALLHQPRVGRLVVGGLADLVMLPGMLPGVGNRFRSGFPAENRGFAGRTPRTRESGPENRPQVVETRENDSRPPVENENGSRPPLAEALLAATRRDVRLVVVDGRPLLGDPDMAPVFEARRVGPRPIRVDDVLKIADSGLTRRIAGCPITEPGVSAQ